MIKNRVILQTTTEYLLHVISDTNAEDENQ